MCVWWTNASDEARPWTAEDERSNLVLIRLEWLVGVIIYVFLILLIQGEK